MRTAILMMMIIVMLAAEASAGTGDCKCFMGRRNAQRSDSLPCNHHALWLTPVSRSTIVNGIAVGFYPEALKPADSLEINGVNVDLNPMGLFVGFGYAFMSLNRLIHSDILDPKVPVMPPPRTKIRGVSIGGGIVTEKTILTGLAVNATCGTEQAMTGVEINGVFSYHVACKGVVVAPLNNIISGKGLQVGILNHCVEGRVVQAGVVNVKKRGKGVQVGIINRCERGRIVQIGLINIIGCRTMPIFNFCRKGRTAKSSGNSIDTLTGGADSNTLQRIENAKRSKMPLYLNSFSVGSNKNN